MRMTGLFVILLLLFLPLPVLAVDTAGQIAFVKGTVTIERGAERIAAQLKTPILQGDTVVTAENGTAKLLMRDDSVLTVYGGSRLEINSYVYDPGQKRAQSTLKLLLGKIRAIISRATLSVQTKTAIAGVKGTNFELWFDPAAQTTWLAVFDGAVEIRNIRAEIAGLRVVKAGQITSVPFNEPPRPPQPLPKQREGAGGREGALRDDGDLPQLIVPVAGGIGLLPGGPALPLTPPVKLEPKSATTPVKLDLVFP